MSQENTPPENNPGDNPGNIPSGIDPSIQKMIEEQVAAALKPMKENLDKAYARRDDAEKKLKELADQKQKDEIARLESEGKAKEALELKLQSEREERERLQNENTALTRDAQVREALAGLPFQNDRARDIAFREIVSQVVKSEKGEWTHKSGLGLAEAAEAFEKDEKNAFLFKSKRNSGGGTPPSGSPGGDSSKTRSLFEMSQEEVLEMAKQGKLPKRK